MTNAGDRWRVNLKEWAIPEEILSKAPTSPWIHPPAVFQIPDEIPLTPSHERAREVSLNSVLDIGCGGGIAAFATDAQHLIGVDHQQEMLEMFQNNAKSRGRDSVVHLGFWPGIEGKVENADVVTAHHVVYNVPMIEDFLTAMDSHSKVRVVIEMPQRHPLPNLSLAWKHFWNLERPTKPNHEDLLEILNELGISANLELWESPTASKLSKADQVGFDLIRLCLPESRREELSEFFEQNPIPHSRSLATIWWDKK